MLSKLIIYTHNNLVYTLSYDEKQQLEYFFTDELNTLVGGIFLAKITHLRNQLAWINYTEDKIGVINLTASSQLQCGSSIICQMTYAGNGDKKAKLNQKIKLVGKYIIISNTPGHKFARELVNPEKYQGISQKYQQYNLIFRSELNNLNDLDFLEQEIEFFGLKFARIQDLSKKLSAPGELLSGSFKYLQLLKNLSFAHNLQIITNDERIFTDLSQYVNMWQIDELSLNESLNVNIPPLDCCQVLHNGSRITVHKLSGINLVDIDSYNANINFFQVNYLAIEDIVQKIKLHDLTGIILIDFIKNINNHQERQIVEKLHSLLYTDWRNSVVLGFTKAGICEIIRSK